MSMVSHQLSAQFGSKVKKRWHRQARALSRGGQTAKYLVIVQYPGKCLGVGLDSLSPLPGTYRPRGGRRVVQDSAGWFGDSLESLDCSVRHPKHGVYNFGLTNITFIDTIYIKYRRQVMTYSAPGKAHRKGISLIELMEMFPTEGAATKWFESQIWPNGRCCGHCGSVATRQVPNSKPMPYWCKDCRSYFSVRTGTSIERSKIPLRKWAIGIYLCLTSLKSVSSMKLHRDLKISQKSAWFMLHRLREAWVPREDDNPFSGPVEVDESYFGGRRRNMSNKRRKQLSDTGRGAVGKTAVVGIKGRTTKQVRAKVTERVDSEHLKGFVIENTAPGATVYTDDALAYDGLPFDHKTVRHSVSEYVKEMAHTNGVESFWSMLKRAHKGTFHKISPKHLNRYVQVLRWEAQYPVC